MVQNDTVSGAVENDIVTKLGGYLRTNFKLHGMTFRGILNTGRGTYYRVDVTRKVILISLRRRRFFRDKVYWEERIVYGVEPLYRKLLEIQTDWMKHRDENLESFAKDIGA